MVEAVLCTALSESFDGKNREAVGHLVGIEVGTVSLCRFLLCTLRRRRGKGWVEALQVATVSGRCIPFPLRKGKNFLFVFCFCAHQIV